MEIQRRLLFPGAFAHEALPRADDDEPDKKRTPKSFSVFSGCASFGRAAVRRVIGRDVPGVC